MGCCILVLLGLIIPRVVMCFIWLLTTWFSQVFSSFIPPLVGFIFMPYTTLAYMAAMLNNHHSLSGGWWILLIVAVMADLGHWGGGRAWYVRRK